MQSPIDVLLDPLTFAFENPNGSAVAQINQAVAAGSISCELELHCDEGPPRAPSATRIEGQPATIHMHVPHLEMVWAVTYGWFVLFEEGVQRPSIAGTFDGRILLNDDLTQRAAQVLNWAAGLRANYSSWPAGLPSPQSFATESERKYVSATNNVFQQAMTFLFFHEFAHASQRHFDFLGAESAPADDISRIQLEREADDFAFRAMISTVADEETRALKAWPILAAALSSLYLVDGPAGVFQQRHPHLHHRVVELLSRLDFSVGGKARDYYHYLCATVFLVVSNGSAARGFEPEILDTADDALVAELDALDAAVGAVAKQHTK